MDLVQVADLGEVRQGAGIAVDWVKSPGRAGRRQGCGLKKLRIERPRTRGLDAGSGGRRPRSGANLLVRRRRRLGFRRRIGGRCFLERFFGFLFLLFHLALSLFVLVVGFQSGAPLIAEPKRYPIRASSPSRTAAAGLHSVTSGCKPAGARHVRVTESPQTALHAVPSWRRLFRSCL